jgi:hypothetical protein
MSAATAVGGDSVASARASAKSGASDARIVRADLAF